MNFVATCPACASRFLVTPTQLAAQQGKVRCGNCLRVFNAMEGLQETAIAEDSVPQQANHEIPQEPKASGLPDSLIADAYIEKPAPAAQTASVVIQAAAGAQDQSSNSAAPADPIEVNSAIQETGANLTSNPAMEEAAAAAAMPAQNIKETPLALPVAENSSKADPVILEDLKLATTDEPFSFEQKTKRRFKLPKSGVQVLIGLLILLAAGQSVYFMRTIVTSQWPVLKPYFLQACNWIGCTIYLPKNAELLVVDDSDLHEDNEREGLIHFTSTLINNSKSAQAYPKLELTLTDTNEKPLLRRTFTPQEYLPANTHWQNGLAGSEEIRVHVALAINEPNVSGYRVFVTY